ncbi:hypothetical protein NQZ68_008399 [Dissostichus eleginoides]|nr:hypothetical protein NQZ68_008399 [Dissostichus eleginoides]
MPCYARILFIVLCLILLGECRKHRSRRKRWSAPAEGHKPGTPLSKKVADGTKSKKLKTSHLLRIDEHDFTMRPAFAGEISELHERQVFPSEPCSWVRGSTSMCSTALVIMMGVKQEAR